MNRDPLLEAIARELKAQDEEPLPDQAQTAERDQDFEDALFRPLDDAERSRLEERVLQLATDKPRDEPARVIPFAQRRRRMAAAILAPLALAAGLFLYLGASPDRAALPGYQLDVRGGASDLRAPAAADSTAPLVLAPGSQLELIARPSTAITGQVGARSYFVQGETVRPWVPTIDISKDGAVRATAGPSAWSNLAPGRWDIVLLIARPEDLPTDATQARKVIASPDEKRIHLLRRAVEVTR